MVIHTFLTILLGIYIVLCSYNKNKVSILQKQFNNTIRKKIYHWLLANITVVGKLIYIITMLPFYHSVLKTKNKLIIIIYPM